MRALLASAAIAAAAIPAVFVIYRQRSGTSVILDLMYAMFFPLALGLALAGKGEEEIRDGGMPRALGPVEGFLHQGGMTHGRRQSIE